MPAAASSPPADTRERILAAARQLVIERGGPGLAVREVARRVGLTPMAIYRHFADRDALLEAVIAEARLRLLVRLQAALSAPTPRARLERSALAYLEFGLQEPEYYELLFMRPLRATGSARDARRSDAGFRFLVDRLREAVAHGCMAAPAHPDHDDPLEGLAIDVWAQLHGLVVLRDRNKLGMSPDALLHHARATVARWFQ